MIAWAKLERGKLFGRRGGNKRWRLGRTGAAWNALGVAIRDFRRFPIQRTDARVAASRKPWVSDADFARIARGRSFAALPRSARRTHYQERDHGRRVAERGSRGKQSHRSDIGASSRPWRRSEPRELYSNSARTQLQIYSAGRSGAVLAPIRPGGS